jgi:hypothetical protein
VVCCGVACWGVDWYCHGAVGVEDGTAAAADPVAGCSAGAPMGAVGALDHAVSGVEASEF